MNAGYIFMLLCLIFIVVGIVVAVYFTDDQNKNLSGTGPSSTTPSSTTPSSTTPSSTGNQEMYDQPTDSHPDAGPKFLVRAIPFEADSPLPAIIPDPTNEHLVTFDHGETKQDSSITIFEIIPDKPNRYRLKNKGTGKYLSYFNDGLWQWSLTPGPNHEILLEYMRVDDTRPVYRLSTYKEAAQNSLYFGYDADGKARASFESADVQANDYLFKVISV